MPVSVVIPNTITGSNFVSSTIAENDYPLWNNSDAYNIGQRVISTVTHRIYECVQDGCFDKDPTDINNRIGFNSLWWSDIGSTNKWAMLDFESSSGSHKAGSFTTVFTPGAFNTIYLQGLAYGTISVTVKDAPGGAVVYSSGTITLDGAIIADYWEYFFSGFVPLSEYIIQDIPSYTNPEVTVVFTALAGEATCGAIVFGTSQDIGRMVAGGKSKPKTNSYISTDEFGNSTITKRGSTTDMSITVAIPIADALFATRLVKQGLDTPALWIACDHIYYSALRAFGICTGEFSYDNIAFVNLNLTVQGFL